jgi:hypothetical protein
MDKIKCNICNKEYSPDCDYKQGRCPLHTPMLTDYHFRFFNLLRVIKELFKSKK